MYLTFRYAIALTFTATALCVSLPASEVALAQASRLVAQLDDVAKKNGFANYGDYNDVVENIMLVLGGFDPQTKQYVGPEAVFKKQIAAVQADKKMPAKDKQAALADLNAALKSPPPAIENKGNIDLVGKYYDKLAAAMQDDE